MNEQQNNLIRKIEWVEQIRDEHFDEQEWEIGLCKLGLKYCLWLSL
ncbi:MAG: hypothetical protein PWQ82_1715 [Thermosediminibacterales bacterium]|nr:hypothetical protein [Thermosediminibacterales bacterium]MDK2836231.1 hypothetical protein [Thermosediminibacterales bacterium]